MLKNEDSVCSYHQCAGTGLKGLSSVFASVVNHWDVKSSNPVLIFDRAVR